MEKGVIAKRAVLLETNAQRWIVGSFIGLNGRIESYEAAAYDDKAPTEYPAILQIVPQGEEPLPADFKFYLDHAKPNDLNNWKRKKQLKHLGIPVLLGAGSLKINDQNYEFIVLERHGKDLWSLFLDHGKKFEEDTAYKITLQLINALKYRHSKTYVHGDISAWNIVVDMLTQNHVYFMNRHSASYPTSDDQVDPSEMCNSASVLLSRDAHMGVLTKRGDMEMLFYNLVQWLGIELPWTKNFKDPSLVLKQKKDAFEDVDKFLKDWSKKIAIPTPVCKYMELLATMDNDNEPKYSSFILVLTYSLRNLFNVPTGNLEFSISSVPFVEQIEEDSDQVNEPQGSFKILGITVAKLANIIAENCRHEGEVNLRDTGPDSLIEILLKLTGKRKSLWRAFQNKIANAWNQDTAGFKTMTRTLWEEKASKRKRTTNQATLTEAGHERLNQKTPTVSAASTSASTSGFNHSNPNIVQSYPVVMNTNETPSQENLASLDLPNISSPNICQTLQDARSASPSRSNPVQSPLFPASTSGYSSRSSSRVDFHSEDLSLFRTSDPFLKSCQSLKEIAVEAKEEADSNDEAVSECWRSESVDGNQWLKAYKWLNSWLETKKPVLIAFGPIPSEPRALISQVEQVQVLLDDFRMRNPRIRQLTHVLAKLPPDSADAQKLIRIQQRWREQLDWLEERGRELGEASLGQVREALQDVSSYLDKLHDGDAEGQQLCKVEALAGQLEGQRALLVNARTVTEQLCQAFSNPAFNDNLRHELRSVNDLYDDLHHRVNVKRAEIERSFNDVRQFDDSCKKIIVWLDKERDMSEKLIVSANPVKLQQQREHYMLVMGKEAEVHELLKRSRDFLSQPQNRENVTQQSLHNLMKSQWDRLKKNSLVISIRLQTCLEHCDNYYERRNVFLDWLKQAEVEFENLQPASLDDTEMILTELSSLNNEVHEKSGEFEQTTSLGETFVGACDKGNDNMTKNELVEMKNRWEKLSNDLYERTQSLKDIACCFAIFGNCLQKLERRVEELTSHDALRHKAEDTNLAIDRIKVLRVEADSLRKPLDDVRTLANDLKAKVDERGIDASCLSSEVNRVAAGIESLKTELVDRLNKAYERKLFNIERDSKPDISNAQDVKPPRSLPTINQSSGELVDLVSDSEGDAETDEKPNLLPAQANPLSGELIDLVSSSDSEDELFEPQRIRPDGVHSVSSDKENDKLKNSQKKRKRPLSIISDSDDSDSDYDDKKVEGQNSRKKSSNSDLRSPCDVREKNQGKKKNKFQKMKI